LTHGFYSKRLRALDNEGAIAMKQALHEELALLRSMLLKYVEWAANMRDMDRFGKALELTGRTVVRIGTLMRIQEALNARGPDENFAALVMRVVGELEVEREFEEEAGGRRNQADLHSL
jgi:hypothetical protein